MHSVPTSLMAYVAAASVLTITPGLDTALVLKTAAGGSPRKATLAGLGIVIQDAAKYPARISNSDRN
jgi:threonine/homoserine/homoserine lactone efflux protein